MVIAPADSSTTDEATSAAIEVAPVSAGAWFALGLLVAYQTLSFMDRTVLTLLVNPIQASLGLTDVQLGLLQGFAFALIYAVIGLPMGWLADRVSRRWLIFCGVAVWSAATVSCGLARSFAGLFLGRAAVGAGEASLSPAAFSLITDTFPRERLAMAIGIYYSGANLGAALAMTLGGLVISALTAAGGLDLPIVGHLLPWQATFVVVGAPGALLALLVLFVRDERRARPAPAAKGAGGGYGELVGFMWQRRSLIACHFLGFPMLAIAVYAVSGWGAAYMGRRFHWDPAAIGLSLGLGVALMISVSNIIYGRLADVLIRKGRQDAYYLVHVIGAAISAPILALAFTSPNPWIFLVLLALGMPMLSGFGGTALASLQLITPARLRGKMSACYMLVLALVGGGLGPLVTAVITENVLHDHAKLGAAVRLVLLITVPLGAALLALGLRPLRRELAAPAG
ncbi:MAG: transporter [Phenylobacterium sp.]|nr:transporter [Phenylobacterium sp.]